MEFAWSPEVCGSNNIAYTSNHIQKQNSVIHFLIVFANIKKINTNLILLKSLQLNMRMISKNAQKRLCVCLMKGCVMRVMMSFYIVYVSLMHVYEIKQLYATEKRIQLRSMSIKLNTHIWRGVRFSWLAATSHTVRPEIVPFETIFAETHQKYQDIEVLSSFIYVIILWDKAP